MKICSTVSSRVTSYPRMRTCRNKRPSWGQSEVEIHRPHTRPPHRPREQMQPYHFIFGELAFDSVQGPASVGDIHILHCDLTMLDFVRNIRLCFISPAGLVWLDY